MLLLKRLQRDFVIAFGLLAAALLGLTRILHDLGSTTEPRLWTVSQAAEQVQLNLPLDSAETLFAADAVVSPVAAEDQPDGFYTRHFEPPVKPPKQAPTTRKVELTYLGFVQAGDGPRIAVVLEGERQWTGGVGGAVVADLAVAAIEPGSLALTNAEGQIHQLEFRQSVTLDVPVQ